MPKGKMNRVSYMVKAKKKDGLFVGPVFEEGYEALMSVLEDCKASGVPPVFFLWVNEPDPEKDRKSQFTLTVAKSQPRDDTGRKPIGQAPRRGSAALDGMFGNSKQTERKGW